MHSEDCLFIDVDPSANSSDPHSVFFFISGGGLNTLANTNSDPEKLIKASGDNIVVSCNYHVGPWIILARVKTYDNLNVGLLNQSKAIKWVQKCIYLVRLQDFISRNYWTEYKPEATRRTPQLMEILLALLRSTYTLLPRVV